MSRIVRKLAFCICENKDADQLRSNREADQHLCFRYSELVQSLYFLNPKFEASSHLLWLYSPVCVGSGQKHRRLVFSQQGSNFTGSKDPECWNPGAWVVVQPDLCGIWSETRRPVFSQQVSNFTGGKDPECWNPGASSALQRQSESYAPFICNNCPLTTA